MLIALCLSCICRRGTILGGDAGVTRPSPAVARRRCPSATTVPHSGTKGRLGAAPAAVVIMSPTGGARRWCRAQSGRSGRPWRRRTHDSVSDTPRSWPTIPPHGPDRPKRPNSYMYPATGTGRRCRVLRPFRPGSLPTFQNGPRPAVPSRRPSGVTRCTSEGAPRHDQVDRGFVRRCWGTYIVIRWFRLSPSGPPWHQPRDKQAAGLVAARADRRLCYGASR